MNRLLTLLKFPKLINSTGLAKTQRRCEGMTTLTVANSGRREKKRRINVNLVIYTGTQPNADKHPGTARLCLWPSPYEWEASRARK